MRWYVYILLCDNKTYYTGQTQNLEKRLDIHISKKSTFTKKFNSIKLVYFEEFKSAANAKNREKQFKGWTSAKKKALIENNKDLLINLSKSTGVVENEEG